MKALVVYSGGLDSTVLLTELVQKLGKENVTTINFSYGSKHNPREAASCLNVCKILGVSLFTYAIPTDGIMFFHDDSKQQKLLSSNLLKSGGEIPEGHYEDEMMKKTVVPFRNGIMLSLATGYAESYNIDKIYLASHAGDRAQYPDCRIEFTEAINKAIQLGTSSNVQVQSPYNTLMKWEIVKLGIDLNAPMKQTWSCYKGLKRPCLVCGTCWERTEAFLKNNIQDPLLTNKEWKKAVEIVQESTT